MKKKIISLLSHSAVKNSIWIIGEKGIQMMISFLITMISARYLGPHNYGILNFGTSFITFFLAIINLGLDSIIVNELINNKNKEGKILGTSLVFRTITSIFSILLIYICILILKPGQKTVVIVTMLQSISLVFQALSFLEYWFQSKYQSKYVSIAKSTAYILMSIYKIYILYNNFSIEWFAISTTLDYLLISIFLFLFYKKEKGPKLKFDFKLGIKLLSKSHHFIISSIMVIIYTQIDKIMIGAMIDEVNIGYYSAALTLCTAASFIPTAVITSAKPIVYNAQKINRELYLKKIRQTFCAVFWICTTIALIIVLFSSPIINLIYGKSYQKATMPLLILITSVPFAQLGSARGIWLVGENLNNYAKKYLLYGAIINIILNYVLIPKIGIIGAAIATLITELSTCLITPLFYKKTRDYTKLVIEGISFNFIGFKKGGTR